MTALVGLFAIDDVRAEYCQFAAARVDAPWGCDERHDRIPLTEAAEFLRVYYSTRSGGDPGEAWQLLTEQARQTYPKDEFNEKWSPSLWTELYDGQVGDAGAEVRSVAEEEGFNRFTVHTRDHGEDTYTIRRNVVVLRKWDGRVFLHYEDGGKRLYVDEGRYPQATMPEATDTYQLPDEKSDPAAFASEFMDNGWLLALCSLTVGEQEWYRTPQGWIMHERVHLSDPPVLFCNPVYADLVTGPA